MVTCWVVDRFFTWVQTYQHPGCWSLDPLTHIPLPGKQLCVISRWLTFAHALIRCMHTPVWLLPFAHTVLLTICTVLPTIRRLTPLQAVDVSHAQMYIAHSSTPDRPKFVRWICRHHLDVASPAESGVNILDPTSKSQIAPNKIQYSAHTIRVHSTSYTTPEALSPATVIFWQESFLQVNYRWNLGFVLPWISHGDWILSPQSLS